MFLKACSQYGLKEQDLFQVNDLYENKNLYMVVDNLYCLGGLVRYRQIFCQPAHDRTIHTAPTDTTLVGGGCAVQPVTFIYI